MITAEKVRPATTYVLTDEKAWNLSEVNLVGGPGEGIRRAQVITVLRDDDLADYFEDMGPADAFTADQFRVPSLWEHTVGELREIAWWLREHPIDPDKIVRTDLIQKFHDAIDGVEGAKVGRTSHLITSKIGDN